MNKQEHFKKYYYDDVYVRKKCLAIADVFSELSDLSTGYIDAMRESAEDIHDIEDTFKLPLYDPECYDNLDTTCNPEIDLDKPYKYESLDERISRVTDNLKYNTIGKATRAYWGMGDKDMSSRILIHTLFRQHLHDNNPDADIFQKEKHNIWQFIENGCKYIK